MLRDTRARSILKAVSYRFWGTGVTAGIAYAITGTFAMALAIGGMDLLAKSMVFFFHERLWNRIRYGRYEVEPVVIWFTGLSGSGKSTLSSRLVERLRAKGLKLEYLDGDAMRKMLPDTGFSREERNIHIRRVGLLASYLQKHGVSVVTSFISPYEESRQFVRSMCKNFIEIHVSTPLDECEKRDVKGLYARARRGEIRCFTGIDDPYEPPSNPELSIDTSRLSLEDSMKKITALVERRLR